MHFIRLSLVVTIGVFTFASHRTLGQNKKPVKDWDKAQKISLAEFNGRVDRAIELLRTKDVIDISDTDHISIIKCINTIFMTHSWKRFSNLGDYKTTSEEARKIQDSINADPKKAFSFFNRFAGGRYDTLWQLADGIQYGWNLAKINPGWIPDRGMGFYFPKLEIELEGTPHRASMYEVEEETKN